MLKIFGQLYYIDFEVLDNFLVIEGNDHVDGIQKTETVNEYFDENGILTSKTITTQDNIKSKEINGVKFELIRNFIEDLGLGSETSSDDYDSALGSRNLNKMSTRFKLAFNTLMFYNILRKAN